jgi:hypothetical protein
VSDDAGRAEGEPHILTFHELPCVRCALQGTRIREVPLCAWLGSYPCLVVRSSNVEEALCAVKMDIICNAQILSTDAHVPARRWMTDAIELPLCRHITPQLGLKLLGLLSEMNLLEHAVPVILDKLDLYHHYGTTLPVVAFETQSAIPEHWPVNTGGIFLLRTISQGQE